ncbi:hypothetical protein AB1N83_004812 [Pleurotus pulmonarius]
MDIYLDAVSAPILVITTGFTILYLQYTMRFFVVLPFLLAAIALARPVEDNEDGFFGSKKKTPSLKDGLLGAAAPVIAIGKETSV